MSEIIQQRKQDETDEHGDVFLDCYSITGKHIPDDRFGNPICDQIAKKYIDSEADDGSEIRLSVFESKSLVKEITQNTTEKIIGCGGKPVTQVEYIVKDKHDGRPEQGIDNPDKDKSDNGCIKL